jgi:hypothetical protein
MLEVIAKGGAVPLAPENRPWIHQLFLADKKKGPARNAQAPHLNLYQIRIR